MVEEIKTVSVNTSIPNKIQEILNEFDIEEIFYLGFGVVVLPPGKTYTEDNVSITNNKSVNLLLTGCNYEKN